MYLEYFALKRHPFRITPDPTLFCPGGGRGEILEALIYAITSGEGIVKVVGEVGSGKTMLCRILEERLPKSVEIVYLANPKLSPHDILYAIAFELKLPVQSGTERLVVMQQLQAYLLGQHAANRGVVVFLEEAQGMPLETLEEIRLLSNLETHRHKLLQIVLFGQPELEKNLRKRDIRQLKERITHSFYLGALTTAEISEYLRFRLQAAGCGKSGVFSSGAERLIAQASCGLIRRINILADKAMLAAYADPAVKISSGVGRAMVRSRHVRAAIRDSEFRLPFFRSSWFKVVGGAALLVLMALALGWNRLPSREGFPFFWTGHSASLVSAKMGSPAGSELALNVVHPEKEIKETVPDSGKPVEAEGQGSAYPAPVTEMSADNASNLAASVHPAFEPSSVSLLPETVAALSPIIDVKQPESLSSESLRQDAVVKSDETLMGQRRKAGSQWLRKVELSSYTIQLMTVDMNSEVEAERILRQVRPVSLLDRIYVCQVSPRNISSGTQGERHVWVIVYGDFPGVTPARKVIETLPPELRRFQPFVRRLDDVLRVKNADGLQG
ncbi:MAG: AAA family ATPase [Desulfocapsaceae bacterium]|jgi:type II secretory pathway predicted ATPase ExeA|nr:AAA family ATPase [Desulfocapsaceae bacterium]